MKDNRTDKEPIRILQVFGRLNRGGAETMLMNIYRKIDLTKVQFDFVVHSGQEDDYCQEIVQRGGKIYRIRKFTGINLIAYCEDWVRLYKTIKNTSIVHGHMRSTASIYLLIAKLFGKTTIIHSHSVSNGKGLVACIKGLLQLPLRIIPDYYFACSENAGKWLFGKRKLKDRNFHILKNGIDIDRFRFSLETRRKVRKSLGIEGQFVVGTTGRIVDVKNPFLIVSIFNYLQFRFPDTKLLWIGSGELEEEVKTKVKDMSLDDKVLFLGTRENVSDYLNGMDLFLFPSKWEGLGLAVIEAQASGLPCLISENLPKEVEITGLIKRESLNASLEQWGNTLIEMKRDYEKRGLSFREEVWKDIENAGYGVEKISKGLERFYCKIKG